MGLEVRAVVDEVGQARVGAQALRGRVTTWAGNAVARAANAGEERRDGEEHRTRWPHTHQTPLRPEWLRLEEVGEPFGIEGVVCRAQLGHAPPPVLDHGRDLDRRPTRPVQLEGLGAYDEVVLR